MAGVRETLPYAPGIDTPTGEEAWIPPILVRYPNGLDLRRADSPANSTDGFRYEITCFEETVRRLRGNEFAFGPGLIDAALDGGGMRRPDAMVFERTSEGLLLRSIMEYRIGHVRPLWKLNGFKVFLDKLRDNPEYFSAKLGELLGESPLVRLIIPDGELHVSFITNHPVDPIKRYSQLGFIVSFSVVRPRTAA